MDRGQLLSDLLAQERSLSRRRSRLQDRIDFVRAGGDRSASAVSTEVRLASLLEQERELSERRRVLHSRIDALREGLRPV